MTEFLASLEPGELVEMGRTDDGQTFWARVERVAPRGGPIVHRRHSFTESGVTVARFDVVEHVLTSLRMDVKAAAEAADGGAR